MSKIKVPKGWVFKYFQVEDGITKFVYEDNLGKEHIYINQEIEQDIPSYEELQERINKAIEVIDLVKPELWNISNKMTYRLLDIKNILLGVDKIEENNKN